MAGIRLSSEFEKPKKPLIQLPKPADAPTKPIAKRYDHYIGKYKLNTEEFTILTLMAKHNRVKYISYNPQTRNFDLLDEGNKRVTSLTALLITSLPKEGVLTLDEILAAN